MAKKFTPQKWPTVIALILFVVLEMLGTWQVHRLHWKTELISHIHDRMAERPVPLPENVANPEDWEYRRVTLAGNFLYGHEFLLGPRQLDEKNGYHMIVPFRRASGGVVMVNRGWISDDLMKQAQRPQGTVQVEGIVQQPRKYRFTPDNNPAKNEWYWADVKAMAEAANLKDPAPVLVTVAAREEGVYPAGGQVRVDLPNDHRAYAIFWYTMAFVLLAVYFISQRKEEKLHVRIR